MKDIYIIGCGGFAREVYFLIKQIGGYKVKAFVDTVVRVDLIIDDKMIPIISEKKLLEKNFTVKPYLAIGIGDPKIIQQISKNIKVIKKYFKVKYNV